MKRCFSTQILVIMCSILLLIRLPRLSLLFNSFNSFVFFPCEENEASERRKDFAGVWMDVVCIFLLEQGIVLLEQCMCESILFSGFKSCLILSLFSPLLPVSSAGPSLSH